MAEVREQPGDNLAIVLELVHPDAYGFDGFQFEAGQFAWIMVGHSPFALTYHPFSISSSAHSRTRVEFTTPVPVGLRPRDVVLDPQYGQVGATLPEPVGGRRDEGLVTGSGTTRAESRPTPGCLVTAIRHVAAAVPRRGVGCGELHRVSNDCIECNPGVGGD